VADEELAADPLAQLEREILERGAAARAAAASRRSKPGEGTYRLGQILYERGRVEEAAAAWRLAASKQHAKAAARLAELLEETGDTDTHS
jgi:TPR repeat protein